MHRLLRGIFTLISLCLAGSIAVAAEPEIINLTLNPAERITTIPEDFIGFGYESSAVAVPGYFSAKNQPLIELYRTLSPHGLIRIGGNVSDHTKYSRGGKAEVHNEKEVTLINQASLVSLGEFAKAAGWDVQWGLNLETGTEAEAAEEAKAVADAIGPRMHSFIIGNEVDLLPKYRGKYDVYYADFLKYKAAIRAALPDAKFSGPDVAGATDWCVKFAKTEAGDLRQITHHYYRTGASRPDATIETLLQRHDGLIAKLKTLDAAAREAKLSYRFNETNSFYGGGKPDVSDTFASALWTLDYFFVLASNGCAGVNLETDINQHAWVSHYSPIFREENRLTARPSYYGMLAFAQAGRGELFKVDVAKTSVNLTAYGTKQEGGEIWLTLINKDLGSDAAVRVVLPPRYHNATALRLAAPAANSKEGVTLGGAAVSADGKWAAKENETIAGDIILKVTVAKTSAVLLRFRQGGGYR